MFPRASSIEKDLKADECNHKKNIQQLSQDIPCSLFSEFRPNIHVGRREHGNTSNHKNTVNSIKCEAYTFANTETKDSSKPVLTVDCIKKRFQPQLREDEEKSSSCSELENQISDSSSSSTSSIMEEFCKPEGTGEKNTGLSTDTLKLSIDIGLNEPEKKLRPLQPRVELDQLKLFEAAIESSFKEASREIVYSSDSNLNNRSSTGIYLLGAKITGLNDNISDCCFTVLTTKDDWLQDKPNKSLSYSQSTGKLQNINHIPPLTAENNCGDQSNGSSTGGYSANKETGLNGTSY